MVTKYDTGDTVLIPVMIRSAQIHNDDIFYTIVDPSDHDKELEVLIPEAVIETYNSK